VPLGFDEGEPTSLMCTCATTAEASCLMILTSVLPLSCPACLHVHGCLFYICTMLAACWFERAHPRLWCCVMQARIAPVVAGREGPEEEVVMG
jgi:hypothetical protein